jgi:hypothetical protein
MARLSTPRRTRTVFKRRKFDDLVKSRNSIEFVIPPNPGPDPGFAGVTLQETFYEIIKFGVKRMISRAEIVSSRFLSSKT